MSVLNKFREERGYVKPDAPYRSVAAEEENKLFNKRLDERKKERDARSKSRKSEEIKNQINEDAQKEIERRDRINALQTARSIQKDDFKSNQLRDSEIIADESHIDTLKETSTKSKDIDLINSRKPYSYIGDQRASQDLKNQISSDYRSYGASRGMKIKEIADAGKLTGLNIDSLMGTIAPENKNIDSELEKIKEYIQTMNEPSTQGSMFNEFNRNADRSSVSQSKKGFVEQNLQNMLANEYTRLMEGLPNNVDKIEKFIQENPEIDPSIDYKKSFVDKLMYGAGTTISHLYSGAKEGIKNAPAFGAAGGAYALAAGQAGPQLLAPEEIITVPAGILSGAAFGMAKGVYDTMARVEAGSAYRDMINQGISPAVAKNAAEVIGPLNGFIEVAEITTMLFGKVPGGIAIEKIKEKAKSKLSEKLVDLTVAYGLSVGTQVVEELVQDNTSMAIKEISKMIDDPSGEKLARLTGKEFIDTQLMTAKETFFATALLSGVGPTMQAINTTQRKTYINETVPNIINQIESDPSLLNQQRSDALIEVKALITNDNFLKNVTEEEKTFAVENVSKINQIVSNQQATAKENNENIQYKPSNFEDVESQFLKEDFTVDSLDVVLNQNLSDNAVKSYKEAKKYGVSSTISDMLSDGKTKHEILNAIKSNLPKKMRNTQDMYLMINRVETVSNEINAQSYFNSMKNSEIAQKNLVQSNPVSKITPVTSISKTQSVNTSELNIDSNYTIENLEIQPVTYAYKNNFGDLYLLNNTRFLDSEKTSVKVIEASDAKSAKYAAIIENAKLDIGNATDVALAIKNGAKVESDSKLISDAKSLLNLDELLFNQVVAKVIPESKAIIIGKNVDSKDSQMNIANELISKGIIADATFNKMIEISKKSPEVIGLKGKADLISYAVKKLKENEAAIAALEFASDKKTKIGAITEQFSRELIKTKDKNVKQRYLESIMSIYESASESVSSIPEKYASMDPIQIIGKNEFSNLFDVVSKSKAFNGVVAEFTNQSNVREFTREELDEKGYYNLEPGKYEITGYQVSETDKTSRIIFNNGVSSDTIAEELIHVLQDRLPEIDPVLNYDIKQWEIVSVKQAEKLNINIPQGKELFAKALVYSEMGWANVEPSLASVFSLPDDIVSRVDEIIGSELFTALAGYQQASVDKSKRAIGNFDQYNIKMMESLVKSNPGINVVLFKADGTIIKDPKGISVAFKEILNGSTEYSYNRSMVNRTLTYLKADPEAIRTIIGQAYQIKPANFTTEEFKQWFGDSKVAFTNDNSNGIYLRDNKLFVSQSQHVDKTSTFLYYDFLKADISKDEALINMLGETAAKELISKGTYQGPFNLPVIMYHGTSVGGFESFDFDKTNPYGLFGGGFYFTDEYRIAESYKNATRPGINNDLYGMTLMFGDKGFQFNLSHGSINVPEGFFNSIDKFIESANRSIYDSLNEFEEIKSTGISYDEMYNLFYSDFSSYGNNKVAVIKFLGDAPISSRQTKLSAMFTRMIEFEKSLRQTSNISDDPYWGRSLYEDVEIEGKKVRRYLSKEELFEFVKENVDVYGIVGNISDAFKEVFAYIPKEPIAKIYKANLSIQNPIDADSMLNEDDMRLIVARLLNKSGMKNPTREQVSIFIDEFNEFVEKNPTYGEKEWDNQSLSLLMKYAHRSLDNNNQLTSVLPVVLKILGYDGLTHMGGVHMGGRKHRVFIAWEPTQIKSIENTGVYSKNNPNINYQLKGGYNETGWTPGITMQNLIDMHPDAYSYTSPKGGHSTQRSKTLSTYEKVYNMIGDKDLKILDASSGLGLGTAKGIEMGFDVTDVEPFPSSDYSPKYTNYDDINEKFDVIISNAVLNVIPQDTRDALVQKMASLLSDRGEMYIMTRGREVLNASTAEILNEKTAEVYIPKQTSYQKGFTKTELVAYLKTILGPEYIVEQLKGVSSIGAKVTAQVVTPKDQAYQVKSVEMLAMHNLTEEKLKKLFKYDGIPVPSIAIVNKDIPLENFGDITLVGSKDLIDPKNNSKNKIFNADVYSPRFPQVTYPIDFKAMKKELPSIYEISNGLWDESYLEQKLENLSPDTLSDLGTVPYGQLAFLHSKGINVDPEYRNKKALWDDFAKEPLKSFLVENGYKFDSQLDLETLEEFESKYRETIKLNAKNWDNWFAKFGDVLMNPIKEKFIDKATQFIISNDRSKLSNLINANSIQTSIEEAINPRKEIDRFATQDKIKAEFDKFSSQESSKWFTDTFSKYFGEGRIKRPNVDPFYSSGARKPDSKIYMTATAENILFAMQGSIKAQESNWTGNTPGELRALSTKQFKSIKDMKEHGSYLVDNATMETVKQKLDDFGAALFSELSKTSKYYNDRYVNSYDQATELAGEFFSKGPKTIERAFRLMKEYGFAENESLAKDLIQYGRELENAPTEYFEAKPQRVVNFNEFGIAVVPNYVSDETIALLKEKGVMDIRKYSDEADRKTILQNLDSMTFQLKKADTQSNSFKEWFGDSKVVNEDGSPMIVYHGTTNMFDEFDYKYIGAQGTSEGYGFYFTNIKSLAEGFSEQVGSFENKKGDVLSVYLNIRKPMNAKELTISKADFMKIIRKFDPTGDDYLSAYGDVSYEGYEKVLKKAVENEYEYINNDVDLISSVLNAAGKDFRKMYEAVQSTTGHDGIVDADPTWGNMRDGKKHTIYIAFFPEQVKSVYNKGEFNSNDPRIYYALKPSDQESFTGKLDTFTFFDEAGISPSKWKMTVQNSVNTPAEISAVLENIDFIVRQKSNAQTLLEAADYIGENGIDQTEAWILSNSPGNEVMYAASMILTELYNNQGRQDKVVDIVIAVSEKATNQGRAIQALSMYNRLTPQGAIKLAAKTISKVITPKDQLDVNEKSSELIDKFGEINENAVNNVEINDVLNEIKELSPEEMLARRIASTMSERGPKSALSQMVDTLFAVAKESPLPKESKLDNPLQAVVDAIKNREQYRDVWNKAKEIVSERFKDDEFAMSELEAYFEKAINRTFEESKLNKAIGNELKAMNIKIRDIVKQHYSVNSNLRTTLVQKLVNDSGLTEDEAIILENHIRRQIKDMTKKSKESILKSMFKEKKQVERKNITDRILELSNLGAMKNNNFKQMVAAKLGLPALTDEAIELLDTQARAIQELENGSREQVVAIARMLDSIAAYVPSSFAQKVALFQTMMQLLNFKTVGRNIIGNSGFAMLEYISDSVSVPLDQMVKMFTGQRTKLFNPIEKLKVQKDAYIEGFKLGLEDALLGIDTSGVNTQFDLPKGKVFRKGPLSAVESTLNIALRATDRAAYSAAFKDSIIEQIRIAKVQEPTPEMIEIANMIGLYRTFQDSNALSDAFVKVKQSLNTFSSYFTGTKDFGLGDFVLKYPKTPANILARGLDYSPIGLIKTAVELYSETSGNKYLKQKIGVEGVSRALVGTALIGIGAKLFSLGLLTGSKDDDEDADVYRLKLNTGFKNYAVNVSALKRYISSGFDPNEANLKQGDYLATYDWFQPASIGIAIGADVEDNKGTTKSLVTQAILAMEAGATTLAEQPLLTGVATIFKGGDIIQGTTEVAKGIPSSFIPTFLSQIKMFVDDTRYSTYDPASWVGTGMNLVYNKIPGVAGKMLPPSISEFGEVSHYFPEDIGMTSKIFNTFLNPAIVSKYQTTPEIDLVFKLMEDTGEVVQFPRSISYKHTIEVDGEKKKITLTPSQYSEVKQFAGTRIKEEYQRELNNGIMRLDDESQVDILYDILGDIGKEVKQYVTDMYNK